MSGAPPAPAANPQLFGHAEAALALAGAARSGRLAHAWLFAGPEGVGKTTLALRFARWLLAGAPPDARDAPALHLDPGDPVFRRVAAGAHADLLHLAPESEPGRRRIIRVEEVRRVRQFLALTAAEGGLRAVVVEQAEAMEAPAANALLKTLEEPPPRTVIILVSAAPGRLLPTLRSRCRRLDFYPLPDAEMRRALEAWGLGAEAGPLLPLAEGAPGRALALADAEGVALAGLAEAVLADPPEGEGAFALAERLAGRDASPAFPAFFALLLRSLTRATLAAARGGPAPGWIARRPLAAWAEAAALIRRQAEEAERLSLDRRATVLVALDTLRGR